MRLAVFTSQFPGKVSTFFARDIRALMEAGLDIDIFAIYPHEPGLWKYVPEILNEKRLPRNKVHHTTILQILREAKPWRLKNTGRFLRDTAVLSYSSARFGFRPIAKSFYTILEAYSWAQKYASDYDHVLAYWANYSATCAYLFHRLSDRSIPFSLLVHAGTDLYRDQVYLRQKLIYADNIIVVCEFNKQFLKEKYPDIFPMLKDKIHVHHPGLDFSEFPYEPEGRSHRTLVGVGNLIKVKGFDYLLRALEKLKQRGVDLQLELVGGGDESRSLMQLADKLGIAEQVKFHGWLTPDQTRQVMRQATILVHPSSGLGDAVPTVIKEAMGLGTPVVATRVAGIPELLDDGRCGILVQPGNSEALANGIETLLTNSTLRMQFAETARLHAEKHFDLWKNGNCLGNLLRSSKRMPPGSYN